MSLPTVTFAQATTVLGSVLAVCVGFLDAKTGSTFGVTWDSAAVGLGLGALLGVTLPAAGKAVA